MLSLFPQLLFLAPFAAFFLRLALAGVFAYSAWVRIPQNSATLRAFGIIDGAIALLFLLGISTQLAALVGILCTAYWLLRPNTSPLPGSTAALACIMCLSLLIMGPGPFAFDLPL